MSKHKTTPQKATHPRLNDVVEDYLLMCKKELSAVTYEAKHRRLLKYVMPFFGAYRVKDLDQNWSALE
ncbi:MAG TPA: hypothetical protein HPP94_02315 [Desulfuromonadales bacterium]|nr:hypothetical protein [Desulfuromonadales bacterium]